MNRGNFEHRQELLNQYKESWILKGYKQESTGTLIKLSRRGRFIRRLEFAAMVYGIRSEAAQT